MSATRAKILEIIYGEDQATLVLENLWFPQGSIHIDVSSSDDFQINEEVIIEVKPAA